jgi:hypothetical protein
MCVSIVEWLGQSNQHAFSHILCICREHVVYALSYFQVYNALLPIMVAMLYHGALELIPATSLKFHILPPASFQRHSSPYASLHLSF